MTKPWVLLFDIDGTLLTAHGAGRTAINRAFEAHFGTTGAIDGIELQGMTDPLIFKEGLAAISQPHRPELVATLIEKYLVYLGDELERPESVKSLPGVPQLLHWLATLGPVVALGLGTGNVEAGARAKLGRVALDHHFTFGGYGSDEAIRSEVLRIGAQRGAAKLGRSVTDCHTLVIGDTPKDVAAAQGIAAPCLAVATGGWSVSSLLGCGAARAVEDLNGPAVYEYLADLLGVPTPQTAFP